MTSGKSLRPAMGNVGKIISSPQGEGGDEQQRHLNPSVLRFNLHLHHYFPGSCSRSPTEKAHVSPKSWWDLRRAIWDEGLPLWLGLLLASNRTLQVTAPPSSPCPAPIMSSGTDPTPLLCVSNSLGADHLFCFIPSLTVVSLKRPQSYHLQK